MNEHVPDDLLAAFVDGDVDTNVAVHVAEHLDACPSCATRAATLEPLASAFAAIDDPVPPDDLAPAVLDALRRPAPGRRAEIAIGASLLASAGLVALLFGDPVAAAVRLGLLLDATARAGAALNSGVGSTLALTAAILAGTVACVAAARVARLDRRLR